MNEKIESLNHRIIESLPKQSPRLFRRILFLMIQ